MFNFLLLMGIVLITFIIVGLAILNEKLNKRAEVSYLEEGFRCGTIIGMVIGIVCAICVYPKTGNTMRILLMIFGISMAGATVGQIIGGLKKKVSKV